MGGRESEREGEMEKNRTERGKKGKKKWGCHEVVPPVYVFPQKQMSGVNSERPVWAYGDISRHCRGIMRSDTSLPLGVLSGPNLILAPLIKP